MITCPAGYSYYDGLCYKCPNGYENVQGVCVQKCQVGWEDDGTYCIRPPDSLYTNTVGFNSQVECAKVSGNACHLCNGKYYPECVDGFSNRCNKCILTCVDGSSDENCKKPTVKPTVAPSELTLAAILIILSLIIFALLIFYQSLKTGYVTSDQVFDDEFGIPGESDAYAIFAGKQKQKLIYV